MFNAVNMQRGSVVTLATLAVIFFLSWAQPILLPLMVGVLISYSLDPLVSALGRLKIPRPIGAALVLGMLLAMIGGAIVPLQQEAVAMLDKVPKAVSQFQKNSDAEPKDEGGVMEKAQKAVKQVEQSAEENDTKTTHQKTGVTKVRIVEPPVDLQKYLMSSSGPALVVITQFFSVLLLVYFLLAVGKLYKRKVVRIAGPSFSRMRKATRIMGEFHQQVRRFLFVMLISGIFVGVITWLAFLALGVEQATLWGVVAGVCSAIPYLGPFLVMIGAGAAAFLQFGTVDSVILVAGTSLIVTSIQGYLLTPWLTSRVSTLNPVAIFIGLLFWGWIWGPMGLIIASPILMIIKVLCNHVANLKPVGEMLGK